LPIYKNRIYLTRHQKNMISVIGSDFEYWKGITGRRAPEELMRIADLINEVKKIKHYFNRVVKARTEIER